MSQRIEAASTARPTVISLFSGAGGLDLGLAAAGFDIRFESDIDPFSCATLSFNGKRAASFGLPGFENGSILCANVEALTGDQILRITGLGRNEIDIVAGGPPCQAFSVFGKRGGTEDRRGTLVFEYARLLAELQPKSFLFENVYGLLTVQRGDLFGHVIDALTSPGGGIEFDVQWLRVNARDFGVPQSRDRVLIFGVRRDLRDGADGKVSLRPLAVERPQNEAGIAWRTVEDGLRGLPLPKSPEGRLIPNHRGRKHGSEVTERYASLRVGERDGRTRINKLDPSKPSFTIVVGSDAGGGKGHVHPVEPRELTPRESARLQTFPDWWIFEGNVRHMIRQVGNAVPPLLGFAIGNALRESIFSLPPIPISAGVRSLSQTHLFRSILELDSVQDAAPVVGEQLQFSL